MEVIVMNKKKAEEYCNNINNTQSIMISIHSIGGEIPKVYYTDANKVVDILKLEFNDTDFSDKIVGGITKKDAAKIKKFINRHPNIERIIVHCDAGQSRSAGIAGAILKYKANDDFQIFNDKRYTPNMLCYSTLLNELMKD